MDIANKYLGIYFRLAECKDIPNIQPLALELLKLDLEYGAIKDQLAADILQHMQEQMLDRK